MFTSLTAVLVALALLATVPVALQAIGIDAARGRALVGHATSAARYSAALSLAVPRGAVAGLLAGCWLVAAAALVWRHRHAPLTHLTVLAWLPAAAAWLVADRLGVRPLGFSGSLVTLTAAHFHHAGFGVSALLAAVDARRGLVVHQLGMVTVAAGLTATHATALPFDAATLPGVRLLEPAGAACIVVALVLWSRHAWRRRSRSIGWRRAAFGISATFWTYPMVLAFGWALAPLGPAAVTGPLTRTLTAMVAQHGAVNAIAVVLLGVAALSPPVPRRQSKSDRHGIPLRTSLDEQGVH